MWRPLLALGAGVVLAAGCSGSGNKPASPERDVLVVPLVGDPNAENFCCAYTEGETERFALLDSAKTCIRRHGRDARWIEGPDCLPCCCRAASPPTDPSRPASYALVTPSECSALGVCVTDDVVECAPAPAALRRGGP